MTTTRKYYRLHGFPIAMKITFRNITPSPLEIAIIPLQREYTKSDTTPPPIPSSKIEADDVIKSPYSDDYFQDPPKSIINKEKEKVISDSGSSPIKKRLRQSVPIVSKTTLAKVFQDNCTKKPQTRNAPVSPSVKTRGLRHTKQPTVTVTKPVTNQRVKC
ncbi:hypothetical protein KY285_010458 [Solanum tuberosum]|nr:hypothetical protein KY289_011015 [Solanum tuberosum]KAH0734751.1 hypothetical protein KY285_010458 [Solanum tuberosum]